MSLVGFIGMEVSPSESWIERICDSGGIPVIVSSLVFRAHVKRVIKGITSN